MTPAGGKGWVRVRRRVSKGGRSRGEGMAGGGWASGDGHVGTNSKSVWEAESAPLATEGMLGTKERDQGCLPVVASWTQTHCEGLKCHCPPHGYFFPDPAGRGMAHRAHRSAARTGSPEGELEASFSTRGGPLHALSLACVGFPIHRERQRAALCSPIFRRPFSCFQGTQGDCCHFSPQDPRARTRGSHLTSQLWQRAGTE